MITKELAEQWAKEAGFVALEKLAAPEKFENLLALAAAYGAEQRETELRAVGMEPEIMPLIDAYATARGEVGNEHFSHECFALREQIRAKLLGEQASAVNQGLIEALEYIGSENASEDVFRRARAAIAAAEQEKTE